MTTTTAAVRTGLLRANGTEIYHEIRGTGPALLCISGAFGDAGYWTSLAERLADRFTVITYDRRGNSRSPRLTGVAATTISEQAEDAAALLRGLGLESATVLGSSAGATILLELVTHHPEVVRRALVHEPPLLTVLPNAAEVEAGLQAAIEPTFISSGPRAAAELFVRINAGDETFESMDRALRSRMLDNAEMFFAFELEPFTRYRPDVRALSSAGVPIVAMAGVDSVGLYYRDATRWLADTTGSPFVEMPGAHVPYLTCPDEFAQALGPFLIAD